MTLFVRQEFTSHAGKQLDWKIECDALTDEDIETLAYLIAKRYQFQEVFGVPRGGLRIEEALKKYRSKSSYFLIVDDVFTTGKSMIDFRENLIKEQGIDVNLVQGVVLFARTKPYYNPEFEWIQPVFQMWG